MFWKKKNVDLYAIKYGTYHIKWHIRFLLPFQQGILIKKFLGGTSDVTGILIRVSYQNNFLCVCFLTNL